MIDAKIIERAKMQRRLDRERARIAAYHRTIATAQALAGESLRRSLEIRRELLALDRASEPETFPDTKPEIPLAKCDSTR